MTAPIIVFGANGGIGEALARRLARTGAPLFLTGRSADKIGPLADEFARVLQADGVLVVVTPLPEHLQELRDGLGLLQVEPAKQERLAASLDAAFTKAHEVAVRYPVAWSAPEVIDLVAMGPNAFHVDATEVVARTAELLEPVRTRVAVTVSTWVKRPGANAAG